jgi:hypothetical protein
MIEAYFRLLEGGTLTAYIQERVEVIRAPGGAVFKLSGEVAERGQFIPIYTEQEQ